MRLSQMQYYHHHRLMTMAIKSGVEGNGEDNQTDEKDESNSNNKSGEEDDNLWQNEQLTIGKETKGGKYK